MELIKKQIHYIKEGKRIFDQFYLDREVNVPDLKGDVKKIIYGNAVTKAEEVRPVENYICVKGRLCFQILYMTADAQPQAESIKGELPFEEMVYVEPDEMETCFIRDMRNEFTCSLIHSRKVSVHAMIETEIGRESLKDEEAAIDVKPDEDIYKKMKKAELLELHTCKNDIFRAKEEISLPGTKESIGKILFTDISARKFEIRLGEDAVLPSGELLVFCIYNSDDGKTDWIEQTVPFEGKIECAGVGEDMYYSVQSSLEDALADVRLDEDGEMRVLAVTASFGLRMNIYKEEETELLEDMYSLKHMTDLTFKDADYEELLVQNHSKCKVSENLSLPELNSEVLQICHGDGSVRVERTSQTGQGLLIEGVLHVSFIYLKADDDLPFGSWQGMIPFSYLLECPAMRQEVRYDLFTRVEQLSVIPAGSEDVEVKAVLGFDIFLRAPVHVKVIAEAAAEKYPDGGGEKRPGIVGYIAKEGDELWDLAKTYMTTTERIKEINSLETDEIKPGEKLLIVRENPAAP